MADQAKLLFVDSNMHESTREDYIKKHGIDPLPIWRAIDETEVRKIIAETDERFVYGEEVCEECEGCEED
jgi:hypothetical protein